MDTKSLAALAIKEKTFSLFVSFRSNSMFLSATRNPLNPFLLLGRDFISSRNNAEITRSARMTRMHNNNVETSTQLTTIQRRKRKFRFVYPLFVSLPQLPGAEEYRGQHPHQSQPPDQIEGSSSPGGVVHARLPDIDDLEAAAAEQIVHPSLVALLQDVLPRE